MNPSLTTIAVRAGVWGGLAAATIDLALSVDASAPAATLASLAFVGLALGATVGALGGTLFAVLALGLGPAHRENVVRALHGEPPGALARAVLAVVLGAGVAIALGAVLATRAFAGSHVSGAALGVAAGIGAGALAATGSYRVLGRLSLPRPLVLLASLTGLAAGGLAIAMRTDGPLEGIAPGPVWSLFAGATGFALAALLGARRQVAGSRRRRLVLRLGGAVALAGAVAVALLHFGADPEVRTASERTSLVGPLLDRVRATFGLDGPALSALARIAAKAPRSPVRTSAVALPTTHPRATPAVPKSHDSRLRAPYHLVLITIDAARADHFGAYGYRRPVSPRLDRFARAGTLFERAYAQETKTKGSIPSLFTSRYPSDLHWDGPRYVPLGHQETTIAERLLHTGYHTAGFVTHSYFLPRYRLHRGFVHYDTALVSTDPDVAFGRPTARLLADRIIDYLRRIPRGRPFFLWAHFFDPHHRYLVHHRFTRWGRRAIDRYDGELAYTDHHVGRVLDALAAHAEANRIAVVVTSDHGEAFREHGRYFHGTSLYNPQTQVPLLIRVPGLPARRVTTPVGLIDVAPTLLDLAGALPEPKHRGRSLVPALLGARLADRPVFSEILPEDRIAARSAVVLRQWKLLYEERRNLLKLFDLRADPGERRNRLRDQPLVASELASLLFSWRARPVPVGKAPLAGARSTASGPAP